MCNSDFYKYLNRYPGNEEVYNRLKNLLYKGSAIAFVGAGAAVPLYPAWNELIKQLSDEAIALGLARKDEIAYWLKQTESDPLDVVSLIRYRLGENYYHEFLSKIFRPMTGDDGKNYTSVQAALMSMNFKAYITTNYDEGLLHARNDIYFGRGGTGFTVWNNKTLINKWINGEIFEEAEVSPILFAHGYHAYPENIILDRKSYDKAYNNTPYSKLIENIWIEKNLVFVGFGFSDLTLTETARRILQQVNIGPRHFAFIGIPDDDLYTSEMRLHFQKKYCTFIIFYPVGQTNHGQPDHSVLSCLLQNLSHEQLPSSPALHRSDPTPKLCSGR